MPPQNENALKAIHSISENFRKAISLLSVPTNADLAKDSLSKVIEGLGGLIASENPEIKNQALHLRGMSNFHLKNYSQALQDLDLVTPKNFNSYFNVMMSSILSLNFEKAEEAFQQALTKHDAESGLNITKPMFHFYFISAFVEVESYSKTLDSLSYLKQFYINTVTTDSYFLRMNSLPDFSLFVEKAGLIFSKSKEVGYANHWFMDLYLASDANGKKIVQEKIYGGINPLINMSLDDIHFYKIIDQTNVKSKDFIPNNSATTKETYIKNTLKKKSVFLKPSFYFTVSILIFLGYLTFETISHDAKNRRPVESISNLTSTTTTLARPVPIQSAVKTDDMMDFMKAVSTLHFILILISFFLLFKSKNLSRSQKYFQFIFALLVPILGPIVVICVHLSDRLKPTYSDRYSGQSIDESRSARLMNNRF